MVAAEPEYFDVDRSVTVNVNRRPERAQRSAVCFGQVSFDELLRYEAGQ
jgi:hypothetical protein